jgi:flagellar biosynthesis/type III secretory pathway chaperone
MTDTMDIGALVITIEEEGQGLTELAGLLDAQAELLVSGQHSTMLDNLSYQEKILRRLGKLEEQRLRLLEEMVAHGHLDSPPARLDELSRRLPEPERSQVAALARRMGEQARHIRRLERRNRELIESGRRTLDGFLKLLVAPRDTNTYGQRQSVDAEPRFFSGAA